MKALWATLKKLVMLPRHEESYMLEKEFGINSRNIETRHFAYSHNSYFGNMK